MTRKRNDGFLRDFEFPSPHWVTLRSSGDMKDPACRRKWCERLGIDFNSVVTAEQVHGTNVAVVGPEHRGTRLSRTDGLVTTGKGLLLAIFTADCLPVFFADPRGGAAGLVHAGWRGLANGIIAEAIKVFVEQCGCRPEHLTAAIGPHIGKCCYAVGNELREAFSLGPMESHLDLSAIAVRQLQQGGIKDVRVSGHCTAHEHELFFSYRREKTASRIMSLLRAGS